MSKSIPETRTLRQGNNLIVEVLILNGFSQSGFYKVVTWMGLKILRGF